MGGTMRLGDKEINISTEGMAHNIYGQDKIIERHRHRYELNNEYRKTLEGKGMVMSGVNAERDLVEIIELKEHPFFLGTQFHPEFQSRPLEPHPLFFAFIKAAIGGKQH